MTSWISTVRVTTIRSERRKSSNRRSKPSTGLLRASTIEGDIWRTSGRGDVYRSSDSLAHSDAIRMREGGAKGETPGARRVNAERTFHSAVESISGINIERVRYDSADTPNRRTSMGTEFNRREFLKMAGIGGVVFASGLALPKISRGAGAPMGTGDDFYFVQLSDTHWGFTGPDANPDPTGTLPKAIEAVNSLSTPPDFIVFTGDLSHITEDPKDRRRRLGEFKEVVSRLKVTSVRFMPGEHDGSLDQSKAFQEFFGDR